jgi:hypothetical protein
MALQSDVAFAQARVVGRDRIICDELTVERYLYKGIGCLNFKGIPLISRLGRDCRGGR